MARKSALLRVDDHDWLHIPGQTKLNSYLTIVNKTRPRIAYFVRLLAKYELCADRHLMRPPSGNFYRLTDDDIAKLRGRVRELIA